MLFHSKQAMFASIIFDMCFALIYSYSFMYHLFLINGGKLENLSYSLRYLTIWNFVSWQLEGLCSRTIKRLVVFKGHANSLFMAQHLQCHHQVFQAECWQHGQSARSVVFIDHIPDRHCTWFDFLNNYIYYNSLDVADGCHHLLAFLLARSGTDLPESIWSNDPDMAQPCMA